MKEEEFKPIAKELLKQFGLVVNDITSREGVLTPDFEAIGKNSKYTLELKIKGDDAEEVTRDSEALSRGELVTKSIPIGPRNRLAGIIRKGVQQMVEHDPEGESFRVIWLHSVGKDPHLHNKRFHSTLFGTEKLFSLRLPNVITCYYFQDSAFFSWRDYLDGAILTYQNNAQLCINTLSPRLKHFRVSELVLSMSNGLCDPDKLEEKSDHVMIADCAIDRKKGDGVIHYLQDKYDLDHLQTIPMQQHTGMIGLQVNEDS